MKAGGAPIVFRFGVFEADLRTGELRKQGLKVRLPEQSFQILAMLLERSGELVTREEIQKRLWPNDTIVEFEHSISAAIHRLRVALGDSADEPRFVETLARRGYRFMVAVESTAEVEALLAEMSRKPNGPTITQPVILVSTRHTVGREQERAGLRAGFEAVKTGRGLVLCVSGEPGIGKTTLVEDFLAELADGSICTMARGRCSERLAGTEAYLPLLEALDSLLHTHVNESQDRVMRLLAPTWYAQLNPVSGGDEESARLLDEVRNASQERRKRELGHFLQEASRIRPVVFFFDDLHWADVSTVDMLAYLAGRLDSLRVLIVATFRPAELLLAKHPFLTVKQELEAHGRCREFSLEFLSQAEIERYLSLEFPEHQFPPELSQLIHARTEGSPLFMADLVRYLRDRGVIAQVDGRWALTQAPEEIEHDLPASVRSMIERKIDQLSKGDRQLLVVASVQGYEFDSAVVSKVLALDMAEVEEQLEALERVHAFLRLVSEEEFPNRTLTQRYRFVHVLYQNALCGALQPTRKTRLSAGPWRERWKITGVNRSRVWLGSWRCCGRRHGSLVGRQTISSSRPKMPVGCLLLTKQWHWRGVVWR